MLQKLLQNIVHKIPEANKITGKIVKPKPKSDTKLSDVEETVLAPEKRTRNTKRFHTNIK